MKAEIIAVGTELLLGQISNTNAQEMSKDLARIGVDVNFHTVVGDNEMRIASAIEDALKRSDVVIITGGLGPTHDDLTREALARVTGRELEERAELAEWLRERFASMGRDMPEANLRQALQPKDATPISNPRGTAPGVFLEEKGKLIYALPGVPFEMRGMMKDFVIPSLNFRDESRQILLSRVLHVVGMGESDLAKRIQNVINHLDKGEGAKIALLASMGEIKVRISAKAHTTNDAMKLIAPVEDDIRAIVGSAVFGVDDDTLESTVGQMMRARGLKVAVAESVSGGLLASRLINVPGASDFMEGGIVTYSLEAKIRELGVPRELLVKRGAVSAGVAEEMARGVRTKWNTPVGLSTTGEAGPEAKESRIGTVFVGLSTNDLTVSRTFIAPGDRPSVRAWASQAALNILRLWLLGELS